jgi:hypothetical protein
LVSTSSIFCADSAVRQSALARDLQFGPLERSPIALERGFALGELRLQGAFIERKKEVPLLDLLPFLEMHLGNLAIDARLDHHGCDRLDAADRGDLDGRRHGDDVVDHDGLSGWPRRRDIASSA